MADEDQPEWMRLLVGGADEQDEGDAAWEEEGGEHVEIPAAEEEVVMPDESLLDLAGCVEIDDEELEESDEALDFDALAEQAAAAQSVLGEEEEPRNTAGDEFLAALDELPDAEKRPAKGIQKTAKSAPAVPPARCNGAQATSSSAAAIAEKVKALQARKAQAAADGAPPAMTAAEVAARIRRLRSSLGTAEASQVAPRPIAGKNAAHGKGADSGKGLAKNGKMQAVPPWRLGKDSRRPDAPKASGAFPKGSSKGAAGQPERADQKGKKADQKGKKGIAKGSDNKGSKKGSKKGEMQATGVKRASSSEELPGQPHAKKPHGASADAVSSRVDPEGRKYNLDTVVVNFANVGASYGKKCLGREKAMFDWEGVRRCCRHLKSQRRLKVVAVINENFTATDNNSAAKREMPPDISKMCETVEETPRLPGFNHSSADDEMTIKCAYRRNCYFLDNDHYRDWKQQLRDEKVRSWLEKHAHFLQMRYFFDKGLGTFDLLEGNVPEALLAPDKGVQPQQMTKQDLWHAPRDR
jgi:hypothetical protein